MPRREVSFVRGNCYHVYNRGANRQTIFPTRDNSLFFLRKTRQYLFGESEFARMSDPNSVASAQSNGRPVAILSWCLMPNHFHFLVRLDCDDFSDRMKSLCKSYAQAINRAESRPAHSSKADSRPLPSKTSRICCICRVTSIGIRWTHVWSPTPLTGSSQATPTTSAGARGRCRAPPSSCVNSARPSATVNSANSMR